MRRKLSLSQAIDAFLIAKQVENRRAKTLSNYRDSLNRFARFAGECTLDHLSLDLARAYLAQLQTARRWESGRSLAPAQDQALSPATIQTHTRILKVFTRWLADEGYVKADPLAKLRLPKTPQQQLPTLTPEQIRQVLAAAQGRSATAQRDYTILVVLLDSGIRVSELCGLSLDKLDLVGGWARVVGKGGKERTVPLGLEARRALVRYVYQARPDSTLNNVFLTLAGGKLTPNAVRLMMRRLQNKLGLAGVRFSPHTLRHTSATQFLRNGGDLAVLKRLLGHTDLKTTEIYLDLLDADLKAAHERAGPLDSLLKRKG